MTQKQLHSTQKMGLQKTRSQIPTGRVVFRHKNLGESTNPTPFHQSPVNSHKKIQKSR